MQSTHVETSNVNTGKNLDNLNSRNFSKIVFIQTFDYSTLYTTFLVKKKKKKKKRLKGIIHIAFYFKNVYSFGTRINLYCQALNERQKCYTENEVFSVLEFLTCRVRMAHCSTSHRPHCSN